MGTLIVRVFCAWAMFGGLLMMAQGAVYSTTESSVRFSQCLIGKVSRSPYFNLKDQSSLADFANEMIRAMGDSSRGVKGPFTRKVLAIAFVSSVADIIILEDSERNDFRKDVYQTALNQCSLAAVGYIDSPFVDEAIRIMDTLEMDKSSAMYDPEVIAGSTSYNGSYVTPERRLEGFDRSAFAPSPVQRAYTPQHSPNSKTADHSGSFAPGRTSAGSQNYPAISSSRMHPSQTAFASAGQFGTYSESSSRGVGQSGAYPKSSLPKEKHEEPLSPPDSKVTDVLSQKEIKTVANSPDNKPEYFAKATFQDTLMTRTEGHVTQSAYVPSTTQTFNDVTLSSTIPATDTQDTDFPIDIPAPDSLSLESIISDILMNSTYFMEAFGSEMDEKQALNKALLITQQSLSGYDSDVVNDALNAVAAAVATVKLISPQSYALAISAALATVLRLHDMPLFAEGAGFTSSMLSNLGGSDESVEQHREDGQESIADYSPSSWQQPVPPLDFQSPALMPEDIQGEIFSEVLSQHLRESSMMTDLFCGNASADVTTYFILVKSAMSEYGMQVSSIAASTISGALADLTPDSLCPSFPRVISNTIAELLYENELLEEADPEELSKRFDFSASTAPAVQSKYGDQKTTPVNVPPATEGSDENVPNLQPSFKENYPEPISTALDESPAVFLPSRTTDIKPGGYSDTQQQEANHDFSDGKSNSKYPSVAYQTVPMTPFVSTPISDEELATTITFIEALTNDTGTTTTENTQTKYPPVNQKELAALLLDEIESVLDALNDRPDEERERMTYSGRTLEDITVTPGIPAESGAETPNESIVDTTESTKGTSIRNHHHRGRKRKRRKSTTAVPTRSISSAAYDSESVSPSSYESQQQVSPEVRSSNQPVVLYPSFEGPVSLDPSSSASSRSSESSDSTQSDDASLILARAVSQIASTTITYIRTSPNYNVLELCARLNELADIVGIPPLERCTEVPLIDYLLNVLKSVTKILKGV